MYLVVEGAGSLSFAWCSPCHHRAAPAIWDGLNLDPGWKAQRVCVCTAENKMINPRPLSHLISPCSPRSVALNTQILRLGKPWWCVRGRDPVSPRNNGLPVRRLHPHSAAQAALITTPPCAFRETPRLWGIGNGTTGKRTPSQKRNALGQGVNNPLSSSREAEWDKERMESTQYLAPRQGLSQVVVTLWRAEGLWPF